MPVSRLEELMTQAADRIWLVPITADEGGLDFNWSDDPAPAPGMDRAEAVEYVRADVHRRELSRLRDERAHEISQAVMQARKEWAAQADPDYLKERDARMKAEAFVEAGAACMHIEKGQNDLAWMHKEIAPDGEEFIGEYGIPYSNKALGAQHCRDEMARLQRSYQRQAKEPAA